MHPNTYKSATPADGPDPRVTKTKKPKVTYPANRHPPTDRINADGTPKLRKA